MRHKLVYAVVVSLLLATSCWSQERLEWDLIWPFFWSGAQGPSVTSGLHYSPHYLPRHPYLVVLQHESPRHRSEPNLGQDYGHHT